MSERRTADIKFRCTPTFKAAVQAQAEAEGIPASQLIENAVQNHIAQKHLYIALPEMVTQPGVESLGPCRGEGMADVPLCPPCIEAGGCKLPAPDEREPTDFYGGPDFDAAGVADIAVPVLNEKPQIAEALEAQAATAPTCSCRAWEFCTHKAKA